jgi:uncharacterized phage protein (TIGR01671 family)
MSRDIRCRVWHPEHDRMIYFHPLYMIFEGERHILTADAVKDLPHTFMAEDAPVMLSTGLKDKNDKEVFAGDIVVLDEEYEGREACSPTIPGKSQAMEVYYDEEFSMFKLRRGAERNYLPISWRSKYVVEVIGNVYENPKLLKETK